MKELSFIDFRNYANKRLNIIKEATSNQYADYVMKNFGKLQESVSQEDLYHIAQQNDLVYSEINMLKNVTYKDSEYDYFVYDSKTCVGVNKDGKIIFIDDFCKDCLYNGKSLNESYVIKVDDDEFLSEFIGPDGNPNDFKVSPYIKAIKYKDINDAKDDLRLLKSISPSSRKFIIEKK